MRLPPLFRGCPVTVRYRSGLRDTAGNPADAASFIRRRLIQLDPGLKAAPAKHQSILFHEFFHFVWVRLGNPRRLSWEAVLQQERAGRARGEAGWSAEWRKRELTDEDTSTRSRKWRDYCCESFCDTASRVHADYDANVTLAPSRLRNRAAWFRTALGSGPFPI